MSAFNGSGAFVISGVGLPYVTATTISSTVSNQLNTDLATGLSTCLTKDGQTTPTANIPLGAFKLTGLGLPTLAGDALSWVASASFTPVLKFGGATTGITYGTQVGKYITFGPIVFFEVQIILTSKGSAVGAATITGAPGTPSANAVLSQFGDALSFTGSLQSKIVSGASTIFLYALGSGVAGAMQESNFTNTSEMSITGFYFIG